MTSGTFPLVVIVLGPRVPVLVPDVIVSIRYSATQVYRYPNTYGDECSGEVTTGSKGSTT